MNEKAHQLRRLATSLAHNERFEEALTAMRECVALQPDDPMVQCDLAWLCKRVHRIDEAEEIYRRLIGRYPRLQAAQFGLGEILNLRQRWAEAVPLLRAALNIGQPPVDYYFRLAEALCKTNRYAEADAILTVGRTRYPQTKELTIQQAMARHGMADHRGALDLVAPLHDVPLAKYLCALLKLTLGDLDGGFADYEVRFAYKAICPKGERHTHLPRWEGNENLTGKTILLHAEQGFGDTLQFARYVPLVAARGARIVLEAQPSLLSLLRGLPSVDALLPLGDPVPEVDFQCPLMSLPRAFGGEIPSAAYLPRPDRPVQDRMRRIGLAWFGSRGHFNDQNRSLRADMLAPILAVPGCEFHVLQTAIRDEDRAWLDGAPVVRHDDSRDFAATAELASRMDLVISADTAVAHLAAALGLKIWVLLPFSADWRWSTGLWYPQARLWQQPRLGDWEKVIAAIAAELHHA